MKKNARLCHSIDFTAQSHLPNLESSCTPGGQPSKGRPVLSCPVLEAAADTVPGSWVKGIMASGAPELGESPGGPPLQAFLTIV